MECSLSENYWQGLFFQLFNQFSYFPPEKNNMQKLQGMIRTGQKCYFFLIVVLMVLAIFFIDY